MYKLINKINICYYIDEMYVYKKIMFLFCNINCD